MQVQIYSLPKASPDTIFIGLNDRDKAWHDLYRLTLSTGEKALVRQNTEKISSWIFDLAGNLRLATRTQPNGDQEILRVEGDKLVSIYSCGVFDTCAPIRFHKDGKRIYLQSNKTSDLTQLLLLDAATGQSSVVESDPKGEVDLGGANFSERTEELTDTYYIGDKRRRYFVDPQVKTDFEWLAAKLPGHEIGVNSKSADESFWLISAASDVEPGETYLFDRKARQLTLQYRIFEKLPRPSLSEMKPIRYRSSDGLEIPAYLTLPRGLAPAKLPLLVVPHGGPWARDQWGYNGLVQFLANRGYAVLLTNFRGSTGYGKKFLNAGNGEWGKKMQDDLTWGVRHLVEQGIADPKRIGIMGGSYGGYATLAGVAFTPEVYRAAVDIVGPSNLNTLLEAIPPYWESFRKTLYARMADPNDPQGKVWLKERSPLNQADKIKTPLMVVQGANDPRVNKAEADQIVVALRDRKFPVEYLVAPDEGHGFQRPVNNMAMFMAVEKFLALHLDGRYQEGGTPEAVARLKEITVDPATVKLADKLDLSKVGLPALGQALKPSTNHYKVLIKAGGQEMALTLTATLAAEGGNWLATEVMESSLGKITDTGVLDAKNLSLTKRTYEQGPVRVEVAFADGMAKGNMSMGGQERPLDVATGGPIFADGPGALEALAALPLAEGYRTYFRRFDIQAAKAKVLEAKVVRSESVTVGNTTYSAWVLEITSAEGGPDRSQLWIDQKERRVVKLEAVLPAMGGALMTAELAN
ncbi:MAG: hypothetical protein OHK0021_23630 [Bryobacter sp.]